MCIWSRSFCLWKPRQWAIRYKHTPYSQGLEREPSLTPIDQLFYFSTGKKQPWLWQLSVHYTGLDQIRFICRYKQKQFLFYMIYHPILNLNHENKLLHQSKATKVGRLLWNPAIYKTEYLGINWIHWVLQTLLIFLIFFFYFSPPLRVN